LRFTTDEIVRAIEAVEQAGLTIYGVEVATNGSIKINTTSPFKKRGVVTTPETGGIHKTKYTQTGSGRDANYMTETDRMRAVRLLMATIDEHIPDIDENDAISAHIMCAAEIARGHGLSKEECLKQIKAALDDAWNAKPATDA
jgi:hypothetical protein